MLLTGGIAEAKPGQVYYGDSSLGQVRKINAQGGTTLVSDDPKLDTPSDVVFDRTGKLYVVDYQATVGADENAVFRINEKTGKAKTIYAGDPLVQPDGIALAPNGHLLVTDLDALDSPANPNGGALFDINPSTGAIRTLASGVGLTDALGVASLPSRGIAVVGLGTYDGVTEVKLSTKAKRPAPDTTLGGGIAALGSGTYFSTDGDGVQRVSPSGVVTNLDPAPADSSGYGIAADFRGRVLFGTETGISAYQDGRPPKLLAATPGGFAEGLEAQPPDCGGLTATIVGTEKKEKILGSNEADVIAGLGGKDTIKGFGGKDVICGGDGRDTLRGNEGRDQLYGDDGNDTCKGGPGRDKTQSC